MNNLNTAFWACLVCSQVWFARGKPGIGLIWLLLAVVARIAIHWENIDGFWARVWRR